MRGIYQNAAWQGDRRQYFGGENARDDGVITYTNNVARHIQIHNFFRSFVETILEFVVTLFFDFQIRKPVWKPESLSLGFVLSGYNRILPTV